MAKLKISPIGTCRIHSPMRQVVLAGSAEMSLGGNYGFTHSSSEALQQLRFMLNKTSIEKIAPLVQLTENLGAVRSREHEPADLYFVEISSYQNLTVYGLPVQLNYTRKHFAEFFKDPQVDKEFWSNLGPESTEKRHQLLQQLPAFHALSKTDQQFLLGMQRTKMSEDEIQTDMEAILALVGREKVIFVTHINGLSEKGSPIASRHTLINTIKKLAKKLEAACYNPTTLMRRIGQTNALDKGGLDLNHFTLGFSEAIANEWNQQYIVPLIQGDLNHLERMRKMEDLRNSVTNIKANWRTGDIKAALQQLRALIRADDTNWAAYEFLGELQYETGDFEGAIDSFNKVIPNTALNDYSESLFAHSHYNLGNWPDVLNIANNTVAEFDNLTSILELSAKAADQLGDTAKALEIYREIFFVGASKSDAAGAQVLHRLVQLGDTEQALHWARQVLKVNPSHPETFQYLWQHLLSENDASGLSKLSKQPATLDVATTLSLAEQAIEKGYYLAAARIVKHLRDEQPKNKNIRTWCESQSIVLQQVGNKHIAQNQEIKAIPALQAAQLLEPKSKEVTASLRKIREGVRSQVRAAFIAKQFDEVISLCLAAERFEIEFADRDLYLGRAHVGKTEYSQAVPYLHQYSLDNPSLKVLTLYAKAAFKADMTAKTMEAFLQIKQLSSTDAEHHAHLAEAVKYLDLMLTRCVKTVRQLIDDEQFETALHLVSLAQQHNPDYQLIAREKGRIMLFLKRQLKTLPAEEHQARLTLAQLILESEPQDEYSLKVAGVESMRLKYYLEAVKFWSVYKTVSGNNDVATKYIQKCEVKLTQNHFAASAT